MERAIDPEWLSLALGGHESLPSPQSLSELLADAELSLLLQKDYVSQELKLTAWYLHAVASAKLSQELYGVERQRAAFQVSAHIFDLMLNLSPQTHIQELMMCFAAQVAYLRSELSPNSIAVYGKRKLSNQYEIDITKNSTQYALSSGIGLLGFDVNYVYRFSQAIQKQLDESLYGWGIDSVFSTPFGAGIGVALASRDIMTYLLYGRESALERANQTLQNCISSPASMDDLTSRWVASHLLNLTSDFSNSSIWTVLPPEIPAGVKRAFALGKPRVLTLWPPQIKLLKNMQVNGKNPLDPSIKRLFISTPTSSGKSLFAQLLIATHLATEKTSVCYIAPTRSLCREVRNSLASRLRYLGKPVVGEITEENFMDLLEDFEPQVDVMTPERLSVLLHTDNQKLINKFGLFIFDEIHAIGESGRGWTLEQDLSFLQYITSGKQHRIVAISAAIGNKLHFVEWLGSNGDQVLPFYSDWRAPRRIHAVCLGITDWQIIKREYLRRSRKFLYRDHYNLFSQLDIRVSQSGKIISYQPASPVGELVFDVNSRDEKIKNKEESTPFYKTLISIIHHLGLLGPVLIIDSTRTGTVRIAVSIAQDLKEIDDHGLDHLLDLVEARLGNNHPLYDVLKKGVAFHHGSLPDDVRALIEDGVRAQKIKYLVATTTMTEGVNLPVRSIVVASQGVYTRDGGYQKFITGSKLINAIGRAGRATKETEGIVVLARNEAPSSDQFSDFFPNDADISADSNLATSKALEELAAFEREVAARQDAIFDANTDTLRDFIKFIWFVSAELEKINPTEPLEDIDRLLANTLAWTQLKKDDRKRWVALGSIVVNEYKKIDSLTRRRWAASGATLKSAHILDEIAKEIASDIIDEQAKDNFDQIINIIFSKNRILRLLSLNEAPGLQIYDKRSGQFRQAIGIPFDEVIRQWVKGAELKQLAASSFTEVKNLNYRFEQLGDFVNKYFEVFFPWVLGIIVTWSNLILQEKGYTPLIPSTLAAHVRRGVDSKTALDLLGSGIQSRTLALKIARIWDIRPYGSLDLLSWIRSMTIIEWQRNFGATTLELRNLIEYSRERTNNLVEQVISGKKAQVNFSCNCDDLSTTNVACRKNDDSEVSAIGIWQDDKLYATLPSQHQDDIYTLLETGFAFDYKFTVVSGVATLEISLQEME